MAKHDYIFLNGKLFEFTTRQMKEIVIGSSIDRTLSGKAKRDIVTTKKQWSFSFDLIDDATLLRFYNIFWTKTVINLTDYDGKTYSVLWTNDWEPEETQSGNEYVLSVTFDEE